MTVLRSWTNSTAVAVVNSRRKATDCSRAGPSGGVIEETAEAYEHANEGGTPLGEVFLE